MESQEILLSIIAGLLSVVNAYFWYDKVQADKRAKDIENQLIDIRAKQQHYTTQNEVKEMIRESIEPLRQDQREIKTDVKEVISLIGRMSQDLAVINALKGAHLHGIHNSSN